MQRPRGRFLRQVSLTHPHALTFILSLAKTYRGWLLQHLPWAPRDSTTTQYDVCMCWSADSVSRSRSSSAILYREYHQDHEDEARRCTPRFRPRRRFLWNSLYRPSNYNRTIRAIKGAVLSVERVIFKADWSIDTFVCRLACCSNNMNGKNAMQFFYGPIFLIYFEMYIHALLLPLYV